MASHCMKGTVRFTSKVFEFEIICFDIYDVLTATYVIQDIPSPYGMPKFEMLMTSMGINNLHVIVIDTSVSNFTGD